MIAVISLHTNLCDALLHKTHFIDLHVP